MVEQSQSSGYIGRARGLELGAEKQQGVVFHARKNIGEAFKCMPWVSSRGYDTDSRPRNHLTKADSEGQMKRLSIVLVTFAGLVTSVAIAAEVHSSPFAPGVRTLMLAHNAYPDEAKFGDRLDSAISGGPLFAVEEDLVWVDGKSLLIHNPKAARPDSPTLESYFFPKVAPIVEKALKEDNPWRLATHHALPRYKERSRGAPASHLESAGQVRRVVDEGGQDR